MAMDSLSAFVRYSLYEHRWNAYQIFTRLRFLQRSQWQTPDALREVQQRKLDALLGYASRSIPYYREILAGSRGGGVCPLQQLKSFPVLDKIQIRRDIDRFKPVQTMRGKVFEGSTSGTTGTPFRYLRDWNTIVWTQAAMLRGKSWAGYRFGMPYVLFQNRTFPSTLGRLRSLLAGYRMFPICLTESEASTFAKRLSQIRVRFVESFPSVLCALAYAAQRLRVRINIPVIFTTGEMLYPGQRDLVEQQFQGRVYDYYGCNEIGSLAYECELGSKHCTDEHVLIETVDSNDKPVTGQSGDVVITDLDNYAMPLIRYKNGDTATLEEKPCACGRGLNVISHLDGRHQDHLVGTNGCRVPAIYYSSEFRNVRGVDEYQLHQSATGPVTLRIVRNPSFSSAELDFMIHTIQHSLGVASVVKADHTAPIFRTARGKTPLIVRER